jgi:hypothetical protein
MGEIINLPNSLAVRVKAMTEKQNA